MRDSSGFDETDAVDPRASLGLPPTTHTSSGHTNDSQTFPASNNTAILALDVSSQESESDLAQLPPFEYLPLAEDDHFRLARITPGYGTQIIGIQLEDVQLVVESSKPPVAKYKCLSYRWQPPLQTASILINGCRFGVTEDLLAALRSVRKKESEVVIWIDQICINQDDYAERAYQVSIKKHIYRRAEQVIVGKIELRFFADTANFLKRSGLESSSPEPRCSITPNN